METCIDAPLYLCLILSVLSLSRGVDLGKHRLRTLRMAWINLQRSVYLFRTQATAFLLHSLSGILLFSRLCGLNMKQFAIVGCGKMGQSLAKCIVPVLSCKCVCCDVADSALSEIQKLFGDKVECTKDIKAVANSCDVVLLAVKPVHAPKVLEILGSGIQKTILSIVAGITSQTLKSLAGTPSVIRIMPNTPALVGAGSIVILDDNLPDEKKAILSKLFASAGFVHFVQNESMMDAVTGLSGSGPALFAIMAEALADAAVAQGLPRNLASDLARETMFGTARLLEVQHPDILKESVMSPGGTTAAGILAAENAGFRSASQTFVIAATQKSRDMR